MIAPGDCHAPGETVFGTRPRPRELSVLAETILHGSIREAATCRGISYQTAKNALSRLYTRLGAVSLGHALYLVGWAAIPAQAARPHRILCPEEVA